eukprot:1438222-Amphidinium_carterae.1
MHSRPLHLVLVVSNVSDVMVVDHNAINAGDVTCLPPPSGFRRVLADSANGGVVQIDMIKAMLLWDRLHRRSTFAENLDYAQIQSSLEVVSNRNGERNSLETARVLRSMEELRATRLLLSAGMWCGYKYR